MFSNVDGERSRISSSGTSQGGRHRYFLMLMVGAPGSPAPTPPRRRRQCFLALVVDATGSLASTPPKGSTVNVF
jgi:hypothetical protein